MNKLKKDKLNISNKLNFQCLKTLDVLFINGNIQTLGSLIFYVDK